LAFASNIWVTSENNKNALEIERFKAQSTIILQAIKTGNQTDACKNLVVFVKLGLVDDENQTIHKGCPNEFPQDAAPSLPAYEFTTSPSLSGLATPSVISANASPLTGFPAPTLTGVVQDADTHKPIEGASVFYDPQHVTTTPKDGSFSLPAPPLPFPSTTIGDLHIGGPDYVRVEKDGYAPVTVPIWLSQKDTVIPLHRVASQNHKR
jgi:hypothetical protein